MGRGGEIPKNVYFSPFSGTIRTRVYLDVFGPLTRERGRRHRLDDVIR